MPKPLFTAGNPGKPKGAVSQKTKLGQSLAELMKDEIELLVESVQALRLKNPEKYIDSMMSLLPYIVKKMPVAHEVAVQNANLDTSAMRELSIDARLRIRDILLSEGKQNLLLDAAN
jgi:hypothetical protein